jgi:hypothetical protein
MKATTIIFVCVLAAGMASAQSPSIIQNTRDTMNGVSSNATAASNMALSVGDQAPSAASATKAASTSNSASPFAPAQGATKISTKPAHKAHKRPVIVATPVETAKTGDGKSGDKKSGDSKNNDPSAAIVAGTAAPGSEGPGDDEPGAADKKYNPNGKRDPFLSPVVSKAGGSGCTTGKKCLEIGTISLRGIVHAESGFIAVVSNGMNKAYFLHENDPVFNGYVVKITGDSIVFQETLQDRLGKTFTREVVKKITTPAV